MKLLNYITHNWKIKVVAIIVAAGMWVYAASIETNVAKFPSAIPISVVNLTPGYTAIFDQKEVKIEIAADAAVWQKLSASSFTAFIDLNGFSAGTYEVPLNVTTQVADLSIISKDPNVLVVTIEPAIEKEIPVVPRIEGDAAENMIAGDVIFDPASVKISGPESVVSGISQATAEIVLSGESHDFSKAAKLVALDNKNQPIKNVSFSPQSVVANIKIVRAGNIKNVGIRVVTSGSPAKGFFVSSVATDPAVISISGVPNIIRTISSIPTEDIDISGASQTISTTVTLNMPNGVRSDNTNTVSATIVISQIATTKPLTIPIDFTNTPPGLKIGSVSSQSVDVVVSGQASAIEATGAENIKITLDLSTAKAGENTFAVLVGNFSIPAGISIQTFSPQSITVILD